jgi:tetratricopeptide (TPR) repeat protein
MIVKNEAQFLAQCLESIRAAADQIVVVDTGSTDDTQAVARSFGAEVYEAPWRDDFSWARNISLDHATCSWILWLDADDFVPGASVEKIHALKKEKPDRAYLFTVRNERPNNTGTEFLQARMFPNHPAIRFERRIHEIIMPSIRRINLPEINKNDIIVEHRGYADPETLKKKAQRNIDLLLRDYSSVSPDPIMTIEIADAYNLVENWDEALRWYGKVLALEACETRSPVIASQAYYGIGSIYNRQNKFEQAIPALESALRLADRRPDALYIIAVCYDCLGKFDKAIGCFKEILTAEGKPNLVGVDFRAVKLKATLRLLRILAETSPAEARVEARKAVALNPGRLEIRLMAAKVMFAHGTLMDALKYFEESLPKGEPGHIDTHIGLCLIYRIAQRMDTARQSLDTIRPFFDNNLRYWAFRTRFLDENNFPDRFTIDEIERERALIQRDFFNKA